MLAYTYSDISIPDSLAAFLKETLDEDASIESVELIPTRLGWGMVQDILLKSADGQAFRRVYGFEPIEARLLVKREGGIIQLCSAR